MSDCTVIDFIPCSRELPEMRRLVVMASPSGGIHFGHRVPCGRNGGGWYWAVGNRQSLAQGAVTAWAPMIQHPDRAGL